MSRARDLRIGATGSGRRASALSRPLQPTGERNFAAATVATMLDEGREMTLPGCVVLRFSADGRRRELRE